MGAAAIAMMAGGALLNAKGQYDAGMGEASLYNFNAGMARKAAVDAVSRGAFEAGLARTEGTRVISSANAATGASGFSVQDETALGVAETTRGVAALDVEMIKTNALREALGFENQAEDFKFRAKLAKRKAVTGSVSSLLTGGSMLASSFPNFGSGGA